MKRMIALMMTMSLIGLAGCGSMQRSRSTSAETGTGSSQSVSAAHDTDFPVSPADSELYTPQEMGGIWTEKYDGSGRIEISENDANIFVVKISRDTPNGEKHMWIMAAEPAGSNLLCYKGCIHTMHTFENDGTETEKTLHENGTGTITLLSTHELMWQDDVDNAGENLVFVNAG